jgi:hypothetical protein
LIRNRFLSVPFSGLDSRRYLAPGARGLSPVTMGANCSASVFCYVIHFLSLEVMA